MKKKWIGLALVLVLALGMALLYAFGPIVGPMPLWMSILPPLVAIVMALLIKEVISSLFVGILTGTFLMALYGGASPVSALGGGLLRVVDTYVVNSLFDADHVTIIVFTLIIGGMVRIITVNGGMQGVVNWLLSRRAHGPRSGQLMTFLMDLCIFFDDYSNTLVVGNTMRPVADKLKVSREKLAYIVDSTSAPVVAVAFVTTWIGAELSYIQDGIRAIGLEASAYSVFFHSLAYSFYPFLTLGFVLMIIFSGRDFGPMLKAERKARNASAMEIEMTNGVSKPAHIIDALIPLAVLIFGTIMGLIVTGYDASVWHAETGFFSQLSATIGAANSYKALLWASLLSLLTTIVMTLLRGDMEFGKIMEEMVEGFKAMFNAVLILTMAWSIALVTKDMHTAEFVSQLLLQWSLSPWLVPVLTFALAALIGFSTGTSWGTMAILYPLILPASWLLCQEQGLNVEATMPLFYNVVASVLAGSVMGDHCSPISDTTIMSSLASSCNHMQHVSTQMPYALTVGATALLMGVLPTALGLPSWVAFLTGFAVLWLVVRFVGKKV